MEAKRIVKIPKVAKGSSIYFTKLTVEEEIAEYLSIDGYSMEMTKDHVQVFGRDIDSYNTFPVCVLSHMYDPKRSLHLKDLIEEAKVHDLSRKFHIFTYSDQEDLYKRFESIKNVEVVYIPADKKEYSTLCGKRQFILEWNQEKGNDDAFFIEDDCTKFCLPIGQHGADGLKNFRNGRYHMSFNFTFGYWEFLARRYDMKYSGILNNMEFAFRDVGTERALADPLTKGFIKKNAQVVQAVHINTKNCKDNDIKFDDTAGWDDYDQIVQQCVFAEGTRGLMIGYFTPALKSGISAMSSSADALAIRCEKNSKALIAKWGLGLVREDTKKGLYNAKVNWHTLKAGLDVGINIKDFIGKSKEDCKALIEIAKNGTASVSGGKDITKIYKPTQTVVLEELSDTDSLF